MGVRLRSSVAMQHETPLHSYGIPIEESGALQMMPILRFVSPILAVAMLGAQAPVASVDGRMQQMRNLRVT